MKNAIFTFEIEGIREVFKDAECKCDIRWVHLLFKEFQKNCYVFVLRHLSYKGHVVLRRSFKRD